MKQHQQNKTVFPHKHSYLGQVLKKTHIYMRATTSFDLTRPYNTYEITHVKETCISRQTYIFPSNSEEN